MTDGDCLWLDATPYLICSSVSGHEGSVSIPTVRNIAVMCAGAHRPFEYLFAYR